MINMLEESVCEKWKRVYKAYGPGLPGVPVDILDFAVFKFS